jgi:hypothetical protein
LIEPFRWSTFVKAHRLCFPVEELAVFGHAPAVTLKASALLADILSGDGQNARETIRAF